MKNTQYIKKLTGKLRDDEMGNKARSLLFLKKQGCRIPLTYVLSAKAFEDYRRIGKPLLESIKSELSGLADLNYAIRSSTSFEDSRDHSFAGQFQTLINIKGPEKILEAILEVWESAGISGTSEYRSIVTTDATIPACAVVIQEMVESVLSGVSFSRNPVNNLNEIVVEAVEGLGEELVQKGVTPMRWRIKGEFLLEGDDSGPAFTIVRAVASATKKLKKSYHDDVDIEWAHDGNNLYFLQLRFITALESIPVYSNRMAREMLPGQIKPLVWSVNIPLVNGTWIELLTEITGPLAIQPEDLAKSFYFRTYFNMAALGEVFNKFGLPVESIEYMFMSEQGKMPKMMPGIKTFRHTFRMIRFAHSKLLFEPTFIRRYGILSKSFVELRKRIQLGVTIEEYPALFDELFKEGRKITYINIVVPLLMQMYNKRLRNRLKAIGYDYDLIDFTGDFPVLEELSPMKAMDRVRKAFEHLQNTDGEDSFSFERLGLLPDSDPCRKEFDLFLERFGHFSESGNDFSVPKWEEDPPFVLNMILQSDVSLEKKKLIPFSELKLPALKRAGLRRLYRRAGSFRVYREQVSSLYIMGYGLFRTLFLGVGREFAKRGILLEPSDIFFLTRTEIDRILTMPAMEAGREFIPLASERKKEMAETRDLLLPTIIYGESAPLVERGQSRNIKAVGASPGVFRGRTKVVRGSADFSRVNRGDVLLIPFSDVSWTPVLVKAGAIVSEAGGMLSHCSIIARELGIPALVSVENACAIDEGIEVTIDGSNGLLTITEYE